MWIGTPGAMQYIEDKARSFDRTPQLAVSEFRALGGGVTVWRAPEAPRRLDLSWEFMQREQFDHVDRLARSVDGSATLSVIDPLSNNVLGARQSLGMGAAGKWWSDAGITLSGAQPGEYSPNEVSVSGPNLRLLWRHPTWPGYPVTPGMWVHWNTPDLVAAGAISALRVDRHDATGASTGAVTTADVSQPLAYQIPEGTAFIRPGVAFAEAGRWMLGRSVLAVGAYPDGAPPLGQDVGPMSITAYTHMGSAADGRYRNISLELMEVTNA